ncbi:unnamed protein product [Strongylus vulgaris]|uniref:Fibronectin type-III domain-containing protein n=1 Tax=Strongylus vulgaris TaxID=40348 RepID=A0A3P7M283_STRVU|nr:unnamed protein product [Strongylus vulgaris]
MSCGITLKTCFFKQDRVGLVALMRSPTDIILLDKTNNSLEVSWTAPEIRETGHSAVINQHLLSVYEFLPATKSLTKKFSLNVPVPMSTYAIGRLTPGSVYNITLQAGTNYGYGTLGWAVFSTLYRNEDGFILKQRLKTPNALTLTWPAQWLPSPTSRFTVGILTFGNQIDLLRVIFFLK